MPPNLPVSVGNMNYTSPILVGLFALIMVAWFTGGRKKFTGPQVSIDFINSLNQQREGKGGVSST